MPNRPSAHPDASVTSEAAREPAGPAVPRRRYRAADVAAHLDMATIGEICVGVSIAGYRSVLDGFFGDESGSQAVLLAALDAGQPDRLKPLAHAVKGSAASLGLRSLQATLREIELQGAGWDAAQCAAAAASLREQRAAAKGLLQRMGFL